MKLQLAILITSISLIAAPALAYKVEVAGRGPGIVQFDEVKPTIVKNTVDKMAEHNVTSDDIKDITISTNMMRNQFNGAQVWVNTKSGGTYLLNVNNMGRITGIDKRK